VYEICRYNGYGIALNRVEGLKIIEYFADLRHTAAQIMSKESQSEKRIQNQKPIMLYWIIKNITLM
jgi:hypothetical protein